MDDSCQEDLVRYLGGQQICAPTMMSAILPYQGQQEPLPSERRGHFTCGHHIDGLMPQNLTNEESKSTMEPAY
jgi:hypothetical protein